MQRVQPSPSTPVARNHDASTVATSKGPVCAGQGQPLTLVLTDVEGSTELWEDGPEAMMEAQKLHDAILRSQLRQHCG